MKDFCYVIYSQNRDEVFIELVVIPEEKDEDTVRKVLDNFFIESFSLNNLPNKNEILSLGYNRDYRYYIVRKDLI